LSIVLISVVTYTFVPEDGRKTETRSEKVNKFYKKKKILKQGCVDGNPCKQEHGAITPQIKKEARQHVTFCPNSSLSFSTFYFL
jgi:hypothetical protein